MRTLFGALILCLLIGPFTGDANDKETSTVKKVSTIPEEPAVSYTLPGIIGQRNNIWIGSDHLMNLTSKIHITADIIKPEDEQLPFSDDEIRGAVIKAFAKEGFETNFTQEEPGPPLPYFNMLIMVQKIRGGYAVSIQGRLFEKVSIKRVILPEEISFQAITWEKVNLSIAPSEQLTEEVLKSTEEIADTFLKRYKFFEHQKEKIRER